TERPFKHQEKDYLLYKFNRFQACRYGLEGVITDPHTGDRRPLTEDTLRLLEKIAPSAHKIGASSAIEALHRQVVSGLNEAQLMRDFVADGGSLIGLVKKHCEIWAGD
ncbi:glutamate--cysteine ligase, partial [Shigella flexneri]|nr:glutamate--cysteine ligase [Shigella flexneri]